MDITWIFLLKYFSWALTVGTAFVGSWFFEYTTTDKETGRKKLTVWGRGGVVVAGTAVLCSLGLTLWTDYEAARKQKETEKFASQEREQSREHNESLRVALVDIKSLMEGISSTQLSQGDKAILGQKVISLKGIEDYKKHFPDLYQRLIKATSFAETASAVTEGLDRAAVAHISNSPECAVVPRSSEGPLAGGFPGGSFMVGGSAYMSYLITSDEVRFGFADASFKNPPSGIGFRFLFADNTVSKKLMCSGSKIMLSCEHMTTNAAARSVYKELQEKIIVRIEADTNVYEVPSAVAEDIKTTFSCISL